MNRLLEAARIEAEYVGEVLVDFISIISSLFSPTLMYQIQEPDELRRMVIDAALAQKISLDHLTTDEKVWILNFVMTDRVDRLNNSGHPMAFAEEECPSIH